MGKLTASSNISGYLKRWMFEDIEKIYAGLGCVMAQTKDGSVLQMVLEEENTARTEYWKNIQSIAISQYYSALAVGLVNDGTCMISKRPARKYCKDQE